jgi:hypothetical protein
VSKKEEVTKKNIYIDCTNGPNDVLFSPFEDEINMHGMEPR